MKRKEGGQTTGALKKQKRSSPPAALLKLFRKHYGETATEDQYGAVFRMVKESFQEDIHRVLYPGCFVHITPSLFFREVVYVDSFKGAANQVQRFYDNAQVLDTLVRDPGQCLDHRITFHQVDYRSDFGEPEASFDMVISLNCGPVSAACLKYLRLGGAFLVHNDHGDASLAYTSPELELRSVLYRGAKGEIKWDSSKERLEDCFKLKKTGEPISREQAMKNTKVGRTKWKFRLRGDSKVFFYLFRKIKLL